MAGFKDMIIEYSLKQIIKEGALKNKKVYLFGANGYAKFILQFLKTAGICAEGIFDNSLQKRGMFIEDVIVEAPHKEENSDFAVVLIASAYYNVMLKQLEELGYRRELVLNLLDGRLEGECELLDDIFLDWQLSLCRKGEEISYKIKKSNTNTYLFVAPVASIGDIYLLCLYFGEYLKEQAITDYILAIPGNAGCRLAQAFGYENIVEIRKEDAEALIKYRLLMGSGNCGVYILHSGYLHIRIPCYLLMYKNATWIDNYRKVLFGLKYDKKKKPEFERIPKTFWEYLKNKMNFNEGKTAVLSPHANTLANLPGEFWTILSKQLHEMGYCVYTNVVPGETEIKGTHRLEIPLSYAIELLEKAGLFVGLRNGFCDLISSAACKKIILYTGEVFETIKVIDFYSLNKMGLCDDAVELEVTYSIEQDVKKVLDSI